ncbi:hypothetical protein VZT92_012789 [Zoarces viviparus]|uniref:Uncharacterized protein n=1 Tax=Zoarces viviparus TaxID=48416 RepID=A0AAW1F226_ZOAVI
MSVVLSFLKATASPTDIATNGSARRRLSAGGGLEREHLICTRHQNTEKRLVSRFKETPQAAFVFSASFLLPLSDQ